MALDTRYSNFSVNDMLDAWAPDFNTGYLRIYDGTIPTNADTAVGSQVLLAELRFNSTAFGAAAAGVIMANAFTADTAANATGTASWFRALKSDGTTTLMDGTVGTSNANLVLNSTAIQANAEVQVNSMTITLPKSGT